MNFIHSDTFLPVFFCNFIKMLTTSDWNANDCISETVVFVFFVLFFFHYKMLIEFLMLLVM